MQLPCIFVVENNQYSYSTPLKLTTASADLASKAAAYGMPGERVDGIDDGVLVVIVVQLLHVPGRLVRHMLFMLLYMLSRVIIPVGGGSKMRTDLARCYCGDGSRASRGNPHNREPFEQRSPVHFTVAHTIDQLGNSFCIFYSFVFVCRHTFAPSL